MTTLCLDDLDFNLDDIASVEDSRESFSKLASNVCVREQLEITFKDHPPVPLMRPWVWNLSYIFRTALEKLTEIT